MRKVTVGGVHGQGKKYTISGACITMVAYFTF